MDVIVIPGRPVGQGSKRHVGNGRMIEMSAVKDWRAVAVAYLHNPAAEPFRVPVKVTATFRFARPKSHYRANGDLKEGAPYWHPSSPDLDKLARALGDALTVAGVVQDDRLIAVWAASRVWAETPSTSVTVEALGPVHAP